MSKKVEACEDEERYVLIVASEPIKYYAFLFLLQCRTSSQFVIKCTDSHLPKVEQLLALYSNLGIIEEERTQQQEVFVKGKKKFKANVNVIKVRKIGAVIL